MATTSRRQALSAVEDQGIYSSSCGYCKSRAQTSVAHGLYAHRLTVYDYQELLDRGWRRSGIFLYKPELASTCCPPYTIRLKSSNFIPSKEQKRVSRRMQRYLDGDLEGNKEEPAICERVTKIKNESCHDTPLEMPEDMGRRKISEMIRASILEWAEANEIRIDFQIPEDVIHTASVKLKRQFNNPENELVYTSSIAFATTSMLKRRNMRTPSPTVVAESVTSILNSHATLDGFTVQASKGHINVFLKASEAKAMERSTTPDAKPKPKPASIKCSHMKHELDVCMKKSAFDMEEFLLYKKYQVAVHNDKPESVTEESYKRFLVHTPLVYVPPTGGNTVPPLGFGSFHQQYRIDGHLVAVGVVDILPKCLSSKYLFWDPDFAFLSLGKYSALHEIDWVKSASTRCPSLEYYYLGYYIQSCPKMRYKAAYAPAELLCPFRYQWVPFDIARPLVENNQVACLSDAVSNTKDSIFSTTSNQEKSDKQSALPNELLNDVPLFFARRSWRLKLLEERRFLAQEDFEKLKEQLLKYIEVVGNRLAPQLAYVLG